MCGCATRTAVFLDSEKNTYVGALLSMCSKRTFPFWADLPEALQTGMMQNEAKDSGWQMWPELYSDPVRLDNFMEAMIGISVGRLKAFAEKVDLSSYKTLVDIGGGTGQLAAYVANRHPHMTSLISTDLEQVGPVADKWIKKWGAEDRVKFLASDFLKY